MRNTIKYPRKLLNNLYNYLLKELYIYSSDKVDSTVEILPEYKKLKIEIDTLIADIVKLIYYKELGSDFIKQKISDILVLSAREGRLYSIASYNHGFKDCFSLCKNFLYFLLAIMLLIIFLNLYITFILYCKNIKFLCYNID